MYISPGKQLKANETSIKIFQKAKSSRFKKVQEQESKDQLSLGRGSSTY